MRIYEQEFRIDKPETVGETDKYVDLDNYKDWLEEQLTECRKQLSIQRLESGQHETVIGKTMTTVSMGVLGKNAVAKYLFEDSKKAAKFLIEKGYEIVDDNKAYNKDFAEWARIDTVMFKQ